MLKNVLLVNALSSGATGLLLVLLPGYTAGLFGAAHAWPFVATGIFLMMFALLVFLQSRKPIPHKGWVKLIIALDILWVVESLIIVLPALFGLTRPRLLPDRRCGRLGSFNGFSTGKRATISRNRIVHEKQGPSPGRPMCLPGNPVLLTTHHPNQLPCANVNPFLNKHHGSNINDQRRWH